MITPPDDTTADPHVVIAALRVQLDAALARETALAKALAELTSKPPQRGDEYGARIEHQTANVDIEALRAENEELRAAQAAGLEVLQAMVASPGNTQPVFDLIARQAAKLCEVPIASVAIFDGAMMHLVTQSGFDPAYADVFAEQFPRPPRPDFAMGRAILNRRVEQIEDTGADTWRGFTPPPGPGSALAVPLLRNGMPLGAIAVGRRVRGPYSKTHIALLQIFAEQAVIAIENTRLITEQGEALEQQIATAEVLQVINASPGNLAPVFDAVLERALRLCAATFGTLITYDEERVERVALLGVPPAFAEWSRGNPLTKNAALIARGIATGKPVQATDVTTDAFLATSPSVRDALVGLGGVRALLQVPLVKDAVVVGFIAIFRREPGLFPDKQIALLEGFAAQAVIAMENARLLTEQREALDQQTATAEVLQVINASPGKLAPVFDVILEKAHSLCGIAYGSLELYDGDRFVSVAVHGLSDAFANQLRQGYRASDAPATRPLLAGDRFTHIADAADIDFPIFRAAAELEGIRTVLFVPLRREDVLIGMIASARREVRPFSVKEIALLEGFAAQAVIAIENARLRTEQQEALEQQTATAEVLQVINASPGDLAPVFAAVLEKAIRLCESEFGIFNSYDGECFHAVSTQGVGHGLAEYLRAPIRSGPGLALHRIAQGENVVHIADITDDDAYRSGDPGRRAVADLGGARSQLMVALRKDGNLLGAINIFRQQVRPFSDRQIALVQNFAEQAVIAMENARLLTEQREALEQQTATSDVLQVINSSLGDLAPVFDAILEKAHRLCGVTHGGLMLRDGETFRAVATHSYSGAFETQLRQGYRGADNPITRSLIDGARFVHLPDMSQIDQPMLRASIELEGVRTALYVPLRKDDVLLGMISATRMEIRPFSDKEIALVENFAAQAVIAMENARLLGELQQRTGDLQESLEYQTAISDVLKVISRSTFDLQPVLETLLETAARLCDADGGGISLREGGAYRMAANYKSTTEEYDAFFRNRLMTVDRGSVTGRAVLEARIIHVADVMADPEFTLPAIQLGVARTVLGVPLLRDGIVLGVMILTRKPVLPFTDRQIELVTTFADQAVIAIENVRLVTEQQDALEQQTATAEVLGVINASPGNLAPVFEVMLEKATRLCEADFGILWNFDGELAQAGALHRVPTSYAEMVRAPFRPSPESGPARMMRGEGTFVVADLLEFPPYHAGDPLVRAIVDIAGARSVVISPLRKDAVTLGAITIYRQEVRPFTEKQIALLQNFAAQAVIAMENARLIDEQREALEQQTATAEVLQVINASPGDLAPVFDAVLERALRLCGASFGTLLTYDGERVERVALLGVPPAFVEWSRRHPPTKNAALISRGIETGQPVQATDVMTDAFLATSPSVRDALVELGGIRALLQVPLLKDGAVVGFIAIFRREPGRFPETQIALLEGFAAQALIAMENARLITEQREALEQQAATAEVLRVINASPGNLLPVFDTMLDRAMWLCEAAFGTLVTYDGELIHTVATRGVPAAYTAHIRERHAMGVRAILPPGGPLARAVETKLPVHVLDMMAEGNYRNGIRGHRAIVDLGGARTALIVPLLKDAVVQGFITIFRQEVRIFSDTQVTLLQDFATQAVIAMENARLISEQREALEQQTATAEVLQVINASPGQLAPVFDVILEKAHSLCGIAFGSLELYDGFRFRSVAVHGLSDAFADQLRQGYPASDSPATRPLLAGDRFSHFADAADVDYPVFRSAAELEGIRTVLFVPLRRENVLIGMIASARREVDPFSEKEIALLQNFAAQAVIAMENARLIDEIRAARDNAEATLRELKTAQANLIQAEKMASLGQLTAGIAHEIKNPLNFINNFSDLSVELLDELKATAAPGFAALDADRRAEIDEVVGTLTSNLEKITEHGRRADGIVRGMLEHSRGASGERRTVEINTLVDETLNLAYHGARAQDQSFNVTLERDFAAGIPPVEVSPQDLTRVFLNIFSNGFYAATKRARNGADAGFAPTLNVTTRDAGEAVEIRVRDNGIGIPADIRDKLFQPFFTTKPTGEGTGLGLSITYDIVTQQHGGSIAVDSKVGEYSEFTIRLPRNS